MKSSTPESAAGLCLWLLPWLTLVLASEAQALVIESWVLGEASATVEAAKTAHDEACRSWSHAARERAGSALLHLDCGVIQPVHRAHQFQLSSIARTVIKDSAVGSTGTHEEVRSSYIPAAFSDHQGQSIDHWLKSCNRYQDFLSTLSGTRLLAVSCGIPIEIGNSSGSQLASRATTVFTRTPRLQTLILEESMIGASLWQTDSAMTQNAASKRWNENCRRFRNTLLFQGFGNPTFLDASCGPAGTGRQLADGSHVYQSTSQIALMIPSGANPRQKETLVSGHPHGTLAEAATSFMQRCNETRAGARKTHGEDYIWMSCGVPRLSKTGGRYLFRSEGITILR